MARYLSPGISLIIQRTARLKKPVILDLGTLGTRSASFFVSSRCKLYFENFNDLLSEKADSNYRVLNDSIDNYLLDYGPDVKFDAIFSWDILNYLEPVSIEKLVDKLHRHCHSGTLFHMIKYRGEKIPKNSCEFRLVAENAFETDEKVLIQRQVRAHNTYTLLKHMSYFTMQDEFHDQGIESYLSEHILQYRSDAKYSRYLMTANDIKIVTKPQAVTSSHNTPGLDTLCKYLKGKGATNILDLGKKVSQNIKVFSNYGKNVYVEDLYSSLSWWWSIGNKTHNTLSQQALNYDNNVRFDAIILWDLFNYCTLDQIQLIATKLSDYCYNGTRLFAMVYSSAEIPSKPQKFYLDSERKINITIPTSFCTKEKRTSVLLFKHITGFKLNESFILKPGMQTGISEYLFEYRSE